MLITKNADFNERLPQQYAVWVAAYVSLGTVFIFIYLINFTVQYLRF